VSQGEVISLSYVNNYRVRPSQIFKRDFVAWVSAQMILLPVK